MPEWLSDPNLGHIAIIWGLVGIIKILVKRNPGGQRMINKLVNGKNNPGNPNDLEKRLRAVEGAVIRLDERVKNLEK